MLRRSIFFPLLALTATLAASSIHPLLAADGEAPRSARPVQPPRLNHHPQPRAWTRGVFNITYDLAPEGGVLHARRVRVTARNQTFLPRNAAPDLREHEAVHERINNTEAARIQAALEGMATGTAERRAAHKRVKDAFQKEIRKIDELHRAWDANNIPR